jgi:formylmethanofuran dehydrogenase subunit E
MVKFEEAQARLFKNVFVCKRCKSKQKSTMQRVLQGKIICKKCGGKAFRTLRKAK